MKLIAVPASKFEHVLPLIKEQEALGLSYFHSERTEYESGKYHLFCYKVFFNDDSSELTYENRCSGEVV